MEVILYKDVPKLGEKNTLVKVSDGYARNYLLPNNLAGPATPKALAALEKRRAQREKELEVRKGEFQEKAQKLASLEILIPVDAGEEGKLFGSVTATDIADAILAASQIEVDKKMIDLASPIKVIGEHEVSIGFFQDVVAKVKIKVVSK
ncbi:MAG: 50S ribosomal protein L9 [Candidatus Saganbacteria bacterium]|nr:50S ribosomal protein L9 [Candidatus Saganbacteria bacterium]